MLKGNLGLRNVRCAANGSSKGQRWRGDWTGGGGKSTTTKVLHAAKARGRLVRRSMYVGLRAALVLAKREKQLILEGFRHRLKRWMGH